MKLYQLQGKTLLASEQDPYQPSIPSGCVYYNVLILQRYEHCLLQTLTRRFEKYKKVMK